MNLLVGYDELVAAWVAERIEHIGTREKLGPCTAVGIVNGDKLVAGFVFNNYIGHNIEVSVAAEEHGWHTMPEIMGPLFSYCFDHLGVARITVLTAKRNKAARKRAETLGFKQEGVVRKGIDGKHDAILFGLLRSECRFLDEQKAA